MSAARFVRVLVLAFAILGAFGGPKPAECADKDAEALTNAILAHVRNSLPTAASRSVDEQHRRVRSFTEMAMTMTAPRPDPTAVQGAAIASIDAANGPAATADSLVHAAIIGASTFISYGKLPSPAALKASTPATGASCEPCKEPPHKPPLPSGRQVGTLWVISLPGLIFPEGGYDNCPPIAHYFEYPRDGVSALVLDLRGNQGGYVPIAVCVASQFVKAKTPLIRLRDGKSRTEVLDAIDTGRQTPITLPLALLVDADTESGGLAIAAALQDTQRAKLVGESKEKANGQLFTVLTTPGERDRYVLPIGEIVRLGGAPLAAGIQVDVAVSPKDDSALIAAACAQVPGCEHP